MSMYKLIGQVILCLFAMTVNAQDITILPYKVIANKMIVEIKINGKSVPMIFDTGGKNAITTAIKKEFNAEILQSREIVDANNAKLHVDIVGIDKVEIPNSNTIYKNIPFLAIDNEVFTCLGVGGLIGSDLWKNNTIIIDDRIKEIKIIEGGIDYLKSDKQVIPFVKDANDAPIFVVKIGAFDEARVLFDSGADVFLTLRAQDYPRLEAQGALYMVREGSGNGSVGVLGKSIKTGRRVLLQIPELSIGENHFKKFRANVGTSTESLMGYILTQYGKVTIDYVNKQFHFSPFKSDQIELANNLKRNWDLELRAEGDKMIVGTVWEQLKGKVDVGDVVTHIDKIPIRPTNFCNHIIMGIPALNKKNEALLTIKTRLGIKDIKIERN